jgi:hypothetical protein
MFNDVWTHNDMAFTHRTDYQAPRNDVKQACSVDHEAPVCQVFGLCIAMG